MGRKWGGQQKHTGNAARASYYDPPARGPSFLHTPNRGSRRPLYSVQADGKQGVALSGGPEYTKSGPSATPTHPDSTLITTKRADTAEPLMQCLPGSVGELSTDSLLLIADPTRRPIGQT